MVSIKVLLMALEFMHSVLIRIATLTIWRGDKESVKIALVF
jgi:hypothetical protein